MARDWFATSERIVVLGGYLTPVADAYKKKGLVEATHRIQMCKLAVHDSEWLMVDTWEATQPHYTPTLHVLNHIATQVNAALKNPNPPVQIALLCGADLLASFNIPGIWAEKDVCDVM
jgi:nicotinamide mononucleotide adenylyltransferase